MLQAPGKTVPDIAIEFDKPKLVRLRNRADFVRTARGYIWRAPGFHLQGIPQNQENNSNSIGVGFTCSKKVGNAVTRNRAKRRLRHAADLVLPKFGTPEWNYVIIGLRDRTVNREFTKLIEDLKTGIRRIDRQHDVKKHTRIDECG